MPDELLHLPVIHSILSRYQGTPGALLPILHAVQESVGFIPDAAVDDIAHALNLSLAEVRGVISFYHDFRTSPPARHTLRLCRAESCQSRGSEALAAQLREQLALDDHGTSADGAISLRPVYCLGACACSPALELDGQVHARLTPERLRSLVNGCLEGLSMLKLFIPCDSVARAVGADQVAEALQREAERRQLPLDIQRTSSRGLYWLEPLVECESAEGRKGFGPVTPEDAPSLLDALTGQPGGHSLALGLVEALPYLKSQQRLLFARAGITRPLSLDDYRANGGFKGLEAAIALNGAEVVAAVLDSGLRGRGGAAFPAGIKWRTVRDAGAGQKYVVCNADEGDSGTFADRMLMEGDPFLLIEGMIIAGLAVGADKGYIYVRSEYPDAIRVLDQAFAIARTAGYLGSDVAGSGLAFDLEVRVGAGAYICGEETALLESIEGKRGIVRAKPPLPALQGLFGLPTLVHNVLTLASVPIILAKGAAFYRDFGMGRSLGTMPFQLAGNIRHGGLVERAFGLTLRELVETYGGGTASGRPLKAAQVGGPLGAWVPPSHFDTPLDYEAFAAMGAMLGHGGVVVADDTLNMASMARFALQFCAEESCGKCTPCRIGSTRGMEVVDRLIATSDFSERHDQALLLRDLCDTMQYGSLCAMGGMTAYPVASALKYFPADFGLTTTEAAQ